MYTPVNSINSKSKSAYVFAWQQFLHGQGFTIVGTADSYWGGHTTTASKEFQSANGLHPDGIVGSGTIRKAQSKGFEFPVIQNFEIAGQSNTVIDVSHYQMYNSRRRTDSIDFHSAYVDGIRAIIHKCTQGMGSVDPTYAERVAKAKDAGILWGAYHFSLPGSGEAQANHFLSAIGNHGNTVMALDWEDSSAGQMSAAEAANFVTTIFDKTGKYPLLYSRTGFINHSGATHSELETLSKCPLWLSAYSWGTTHPKLPSSWNKYTIWQFTDNNKGHGAVPVKGIGACDRDIFNGSEEDLQAFWTAHQH